MFNNIKSICGWLCYSAAYDSGPYLQCNGIEQCELLINQSVYYKQWHTSNGTGQQSSWTISYMRINSTKA